MPESTICTVKPPIPDAETIFRNCINSYTTLQQAAASFLADIPTLSPHQIEQRSRQLTSMQKALASEDDHIFAILTLAGTELHDHEVTKAYGHILTEVLDLLDQIEIELQKIKKQLLNPSTTH